MELGAEVSWICIIYNPHFISVPCLILIIKYRDPFNVTRVKTLIQTQTTAYIPNLPRIWACEPHLMDLDSSGDLT